MKLNRKHILLLLLYTKGKSEKENEPINGRTRIIKAMFLFKEEVQKELQKDSPIEFLSLPEFYAWNYGPFSKDVFDDIEFFINNGFIEENSLESKKNEMEQSEQLNWEEDFVIDDSDDLSANYYEECFVLTKKGADFTKNKLYDELTENQKLILSEFKRRINNASLDAIIRYTYLKYPEYTHLSKIRDNVLG